MSNNTKEIIVRNLKRSIIALPDKKEHIDRIAFNDIAETMIIEEHRRILTKFNVSLDLDTLREKYRWNKRTLIGA